MTLFGRFLEGNFSLTTFGRPNFSLTIFGPSKYGQTQISLQKPSKYGQTQLNFRTFSASLFSPTFRASARAFTFMANSCTLSPANTGCVWPSTSPGKTHIPEQSRTSAKSACREAYLAAISSALPTSSMIPLRCPPGEKDKTLFQVVCAPLDSFRGYQPQIISYGDTNTCTNN